MHHLPRTKMDWLFYGLTRAPRECRELFLGIALIGVTTWASAAVKPDAVFIDGAVLQSGVEVPVWGIANDGEQVSVSIAGQMHSTTAKDGKWQIRLSKLATGGPYNLVIKGDNTVTVKNLMVGEVWVGSGQSNMLPGVAQGADSGRSDVEGIDRAVHATPTTFALPARYVDGKEFALWSKYEEIAMHFNGLIMQLRTQALAAVAGVITVSGLAISFAGKPARAREWQILFGTILFLTFAWVALGVLDLLYYDKLLEGAVAAILEHEERTPLLISDTGKEIHDKH